MVSGGTKGRTLLCVPAPSAHTQRGGRELGRGAEPRDGFLGLGSCQLTPGHRSDPPRVLSRSGFNQGCTQQKGEAPPPFGSADPTRAEVERKRSQDELCESCAPPGVLG